MTPEGLSDLVNPTVTLEPIATGCLFTEGPAWHPQERSLVFSDMPGDVRRRWTAEAGVEEIRRPANKCNGMAYDPAGNLVVCEHATSRLVRERKDGSVEVLASGYRDRELNSPNDVAIRETGAIYFTDPIYGRSPGFGVPRPPGLPFRGVYRVAEGLPDEPELLVAEDEFDQPNGLCFSPDGDLLYVNDTPRALIRVYQLDAAGALGQGRLFASGIGDGDADKGAPDGMKCDARGNVWVTGPGGLWVFAPDGSRLGVLPVPEVVGNFAWGGDDWRDLFICASTSVYRTRTLVDGRRPAFTG
ncbi:MAG: SMP-30/gluconolactonase/LRE family protein [Candidatus Dormibacteraeota bacterium]|nr:SMP-30/gluconolactonase/LRE family protein [Candidatus Dormibacteraeota bacterium]